MFDWLSRLFIGRTTLDILRDVVDIAIVGYLIYRALLVVRGTRAMQMGTGLLIIALLYIGAKVFGLTTLQTLLSYVLTSIILIVVVVFQNDIRRALIRVGGRAWFGRKRKMEQSRVIDEVVVAVTELARHRIGALIAIEQDASLMEFTKSEGVLIGAAVTRELLVALFYPESVNKLHDGAVIIRDLKIARAGVFFPMPDGRQLDSSMGSRHRAALGITEETDAVVIVVSEERGTISYCFNGNIVPNIDGTALRQTLVGFLEEERKPPAEEVDRAAVVPQQKGPPSGPRSEPPRELARENATQTPLPRARKSVRVERARIEAVRSAGLETPKSRITATPMPRAMGRDDHDLEERTSTIPREPSDPRSEPRPEEP